MARKMNATILAAMVVVVAAVVTMSNVMTAKARLDLSSISGYINANEVPESTTTTNNNKKKQEEESVAACCDHCICNWNDQCWCADIKPYCHAKCRNCICPTNSQCHCIDIDDFCLPICSSSSANDAAAYIINNGIAN